MADRLEALMCQAISDWDDNRCSPYRVKQITVLTSKDSIQAHWPALWDPSDLEWTSLITAGLAHLLDQATAQYGGTWPLESVTRAVAGRLTGVLQHGPRWCPGEPVNGPSLLSILVRGDGQAHFEGRRRFMARD